MIPIFFVHIPKTAGTSFRKATENCFGSDQVLYDYLPSSAETSALVHKAVYEEQDLFSFYHTLCREDVSFLSGHVHANKYVHLFGVSRTVTFVRDPVQRVVSEYQHFVRHNSYEGDLPSFYRKPQFINRQSKMLQGVPLEAIGLLGLNAAYDKSLAMFNQRYALDVQSVDMNMGRTDKADNYALPDDQLDEINTLNEEDIRLYKHAARLFEQRQALFDSGKRYVHGAIQQVSAKSISGWAWHADDSAAPVVLDIYVAGKKIDTVESKDLRPGLLRLGLPRSGYVGFHVNFAKPLPTGSVIDVFVPETGQLLGKKRIQ